jgi:diguanylate cyclase (GGDEF)-like protein
MKTGGLPKAASDLLLQGLLTAVYVGLGLLSFSLSQINDEVTESLFIPEGFGLAMALLFGLRIWPSVLVGQMVLGLARNIPVVDLAIVTLANVAEVFIGVHVLKRLGFNAALANARDYIVLVLTSSLILQPFTRTVGAVYLAMSSVFKPSLDLLLGVIAIWSVGQAVWQILVAGMLLAVADAMRRKVGARYWLSLLATMLVTAALFFLLGMRVVHHQLPFVYAFSFVYLVMMAITIGFDLVGAMVGNLLLLSLAQYMVHSDGQPLLASSDTEAQLQYLNVFLIGVLLNAGLIGALLKERSDKERRLNTLAHHDYLTGLYNRRYFMENAQRELSRLKRHDTNVGLICVDIDWFKRINDTHGHETGDRVLVFFARVLQKHLRSGDIAARIGGEEFAILVDAAVDLHTVALRLRGHLAEALKQFPDLPRFTVSMGTTHLRKEDADIHAVCRRADAALYEAKRSGRDNVVIDDTCVVLSSRDVA